MSDNGLITNAARRAVLWQRLEAVRAGKTHFDVPIEDLLTVLSDLEHLDSCLRDVRDRLSRLTVDPGTLGVLDAIVYGITVVLEE